MDDCQNRTRLTDQLTFLKDNCYNERGFMVNQNQRDTSSIAMKQNIKDHILAGEGLLTEFKESFDKSLIEEVCAFANSSGGRVILGVTDSGHIKGIDTSNKMRSRIQDTLRRINPGLDITLSVEDNTIVVDVPDGADKPYSCPRGFFKRMGPNTQKLDRNEIIQFIQSEGHIRFEKLIHQTASFERDFDKAAFERFLKLSTITPAIDYRDILKNSEFLAADGRMTNLGVLFFAKDIEFLLQECVIRCILFRGTHNVDIIDDKTYHRGLIDNVDDALAFIQRHTNEEIRIEGEATQSEKIPDYPQMMLREGIVNAVCHRDYFDKSSQLVISVFSDRVLISSPGGLIRGIKPADLGKKSITRNPLITNNFRHIRYAERAGTGIERMRKMAKNHKRKVRMELKYDSCFDVTFYKEKKNKRTLKVVPLAPVKKRGGFLEEARKYDYYNGSGASNIQSIFGVNANLFRSIFGVKIEDFRSIFGVNALETAWYIYESPTITARELASKLPVSKRTIENYLSKLKKAGHIKRVGSDKTGYWEVVKK